jgi:hypothetical protein
VESPLFSAVDECRWSETPSSRIHACTHIGNGPNFMVKSIADQNKVHTPAFLGYVLRYALPFLLPMIAVVWWLFFRG